MTRPSIDAVFPSRGLPEYTYQPRVGLEDQIKQYSESGSGVLLVRGPTKSGKSVLVRKLLPEALYVEAPLAETADGFWANANSYLDGYTGKSAGSEAGTSHEVSASVGFSWGAFFKGGWRAKGDKRDSKEQTRVDAANVVVTQALRRAKRTLVIDDFHVLPRVEQRRIMLTLKPYVDGGGRVIVIAAGHRAKFVPTLVPNMDGSFRAARFTLWDNPDDLVQIALDGWRELGFDADPAIAPRLAENSFGSPQIMQRLCAHLVRHNGHVGAAPEGGATLAAPADDEEFYAGLLEEDEAAVLWVEKFATGPKGKDRTRYETKDGRFLDGYQLLTLAMRNLLPNLSPLASEVQSAIADLTKDPKAKGGAPRNSETTNKLQKLTGIAARPLHDKTSEEDLEHTSDGGGVDPVFEYQDSGATSRVHVVDPFFAYALRWHRL